MKLNHHIKTWVRLLLSIACLIAFSYGMHVNYQSKLPKEVYIRFADLEPLPRGLSSIDKLLNDRLPADSTAITSLIAYRYVGHTLYDVARSNDSLTIPAHITDTLPPVYMTPPAEVTEWQDSLLCGVMALDRYALDYRRIIARYDGQVTRIEWNSFDSIPIYIISLKGHDEPIFINATSPYVKPFYLKAEEVTNAVKAFTRADSVTTELLTEYDNYYLDLFQDLTLPIWKTTADNYTYYINPRTGAYQNFNTASTWLYLKNHALPSLRYKLFAKHPKVWEIMELTMLIIGVLLSLIGVLSFTHKLMYNNYKN